jgi:hypothetical protein
MAAIHILWKIGEFLNYYSASVTGIATAFIAGFTFTLWRTNARQIQLTDRALKLASDEFHSTHRPRIRVKHVWLKSDIWAGERIIIDLIIVKAGNSTAKITNFSLATLVLGTGDVLPNDHRSYVDFGADLLVTSGQSVSLPDISDGRILSDGDNVALREDRCKLYCFGGIDYLDTNDPPKIMRTTFCRVLPMLPRASVAKSSRFRVHDDPDYEYAD